MYTIASQTEEKSGKHHYLFSRKGKVFLELRRSKITLTDVNDLQDFIRFAFEAHSSFYYFGPLVVEVDPSELILTFKDDNISVILQGSSLLKLVVDAFFDPQMVEDTYKDFVESFGRENHEGNALTPRGA